MRVLTDRRLEVPENLEIQLIDERHDLSQQIFFRRDHLEWTQEELAKRAGLTQSQVAKLEAGHANPTHKTLVKLAHAFGCRLAELVTPGIEDVVFGGSIDTGDWWRWGRIGFTGTISSDRVEFEGETFYNYYGTGWTREPLDPFFSNVLGEEEASSADEEAPETPSDEPRLVAA